MHKYIGRFKSRATNAFKSICPARPAFKEEGGWVGARKAQPISMEIPQMLMFRPIPPDPPRIPASPMEISSDQPDPPTELSNQPEPVPAEANL